MDSVEIEGVRLEVAHIPGPETRAPLVFLHEGLGSVAMWQQKGRHWPTEVCRATGRAGWVYSRRGYGRSDPIPSVRDEPGGLHGAWHERTGRHEPDYMHLEAWRVLPALRAQLGVVDPVLVGHSDGATIALLHAGRHAVRACVALAPHVVVEDVALEAISRARLLFEASSARPHADGLRQRLARFHADVDNAFWQWNDIWLDPAFRSFDIRFECTRIAAPLLVVQGLSDEYGTLHQLDEIQRSVPHAQRLELPNCAHSPHRDQPVALTRQVCSFLAEVG